MIYKILLLLAFVFPTSSYAGYSDWNEDDKKLFIASNIAFALDWATTRRMADKNWPDGLYETNPILGRAPHSDAVDLYFIGMVISNYFITDIVPKEYRSKYLTIRIVTHGAAGINNHSLMVRHHINF
jgi:hypothetical protein